MKQIMEHYGGAIVASIVAITLLGIFFGLSYGKSRGVPQMLGEMTDVVLSQNNQMAGTSDAFEKYMDTMMPEILVADSYACIAKEWVGVSDCLIATDANGHQVPLVAQSGWSAGATDGTITVSSDGTEIYVSKPGIYWLMACASTENGRAKNVIVKLLVNEEAAV